MMRRLSMGLATVILAGLWMNLAQAAGSWVATAPAVKVMMSDRRMASSALTPPTPELARGQVMRRVGWQFQPPAGSEVNAWLCHPGDCVRLAGPRGQTKAFSGLPADTPLYLEFSLRDRRQRAATLQGLQVIVNHDHPQRP